MTVRDKSLDDWSAWTRPQQAEIDRLLAENAQLRTDIRDAITTAYSSYAETIKRMRAALGG